MVGIGASRIADDGRIKMSNFKTGTNLFLIVAVGMYIVNGTLRRKIINLKKNN